MVGGIVTSFVGELIVYPSIYFIWRSLKLKRTPLFASNAVEDAPAKPAVPTQGGEES